VAIWIKKNVEFKLIDEYKDNEGRLILPLEIRKNENKRHKYIFNTVGICI
jgi:hypothetical protein